MSTHAVTPARMVPEGSAIARSRSRAVCSRTEQQDLPHRSRASALRQRPAQERDQWAVTLLPLVKRVAYEMREHLPAHVELDELIGAGTLGLLDAVRKFDVRKHAKIETYARYRIRGAILDGLRSLDTVSRDMRKKNKRAEKIYRELEVKLGRAATDAEMAEALGISLRKWYETVQELQAMGIDWLRPMQAVELKEPELEALPAPEGKNQFELCYEQEQREILDRALMRVSERERQILSMYYEQDLTMKQIGDQLGIDESRVSQIHSAAVARLRARVQGMLHPPAPAACLASGSQPQPENRAY